MNWWRKTLATRIGKLPTGGAAKAYKVLNYLKSFPNLTVSYTMEPQKKNGDRFKKTGLSHLLLEGSSRNFIMI
tara:strand:+ start:560 stop:778 length:219 start_codon:yes stop_codon:yes gene_type:complete